MKTAFHNFPLYAHTANFLEGVNLTVGIPLVEQVDHLGVLGITADGRLTHTSGTDGNVSLCKWCSLACQSWWNQIVHWQSWYLWCWEIWVAEMVRMWWNKSCTVPFFAFSFHFKLRRLSSGLDHWSCTSQYGIVWKLNPIWFRFLCLLVDHTSFPYISMYFLHENRLSLLKFHRMMVWSTWLSPNAFLANFGCFHRLPNAGWNLRKSGSWPASCESL